MLKADASTISGVLRPQSPIDSASAPWKFMGFNPNPVPWPCSQARGGRYFVLSDESRIFPPSPAHLAPLIGRFCGRSAGERGVIGTCRVGPGREPHLQGRRAGDRIPAGVVLRTAGAASPDRSDPPRRPEADPSAGPGRRLHRPLRRSQVRGSGSEASVRRRRPPACPRPSAPRPPHGSSPSAPGVMQAVSGSPRFRESRSWMEHRRPLARDRRGVH